jgi:hypothetical protein
MGERFRRITLRADELPPYRAAVIECALAQEHELCERLLGQLASLEAQAFDADPTHPFTFAPPPGGAQLARRALDHLRRQPLRRRPRFGSVPERGTVDWRRRA